MLCISFMYIGIRSTIFIYYATIKTCILASTFRTDVIFNVCCRYISRSLHQIKLGSLETHIKSRLSDLYCSRGQEICDNLRDYIVC
ncbi:hypothetical protein Hanom_Chr09g00767251 [Helianthus anomalus]